MKKIITFTLSLALYSSIYADEVKIYSTGIGTPGINAPELCGLGISADGKYICGAFDQGVAIFAANTETGDLQWAMEGDNGGELRHIDNNGIAVGMGSTDNVDEGILFSAVNGERTVLATPEGYRYLIAEDITPDGNMIVASIMGSNFNEHGGYKIGDGDWQFLPYPSEDELGLLASKLPEEKMSSAKHVSGDGKVILGCLGSFTVPVIWVRNDAGEYEIDLFVSRYVKLSPADYNNADKPLFGLSAFYLDLSNNGRYVSMLGLVAGKSTEYMEVPVIYDVEKRELIIYDEVQPIDTANSGLWPSAIADDGTFIGCIGQPYFDSHGSFIMKAGETVAESFNDAFPTFAEKLGMSEPLGFNLPTGMSADGRYIVGYTYYSSDNYQYEGYYVTYTIDRGEGTGVEKISSDSSDAEIEAIYSLDGRRQNSFAKGVNIVKMSDGTTKKIIK